MGRRKLPVIATPVDPAESAVIDKVMHLRGYAARSDAVRFCVRFFGRELAQKRFALEVIKVEARKGNLVPFQQFIDQGIVDPETALEAMARDAPVDLDLLTMSKEDLEATVEVLEEEIRRAVHQSDEVQREGADPGGPAPVSHQLHPGPPEHGGE